MAKGLICGFLGILTATVGIDSVTSYIRFTDNANLLSGIQYIPVMIGLFAMSQAFESMAHQPAACEACIKVQLC